MAIDVFELGTPARQDMRLGPDDRDNQILELSALKQLKHVKFAVTTDVGIFGVKD